MLRSCFHLIFTLCFDARRSRARCVQSTLQVLKLFFMNTSFTTENVCTKRRAQQHSYSTLCVIREEMMRKEARRITVGNGYVRGLT
jgi:hypothetical protein